MILQPANPRSAKETAPPEGRWVNPLQFENWDELLGTHPEATVFHTRGWAETLAKTYHYSPHYLLAADQKRLWALLPIFEVNSCLTGKRGISLPFTDECAPLVSTATPVERLWERSCALGNEQKWKYLEMRGATPTSSVTSTQYYEHSLDLSAPEEQIFNHFDSANRRAIRKGEKAGVSCEISRSIDSLKEYYRFHQITRKKHGLPPQPYSFFENIWTSLINKGRGQILIATQNQRPIASAIFLHFKKRAIYKFGASDPAFQDLRPNNLIMWQAIRHFLSAGIETLSFGRTSLHQEGLRRFKLGFGANEKLLNYVKYDFRRAEFVTAADVSSGAHAYIFKHLPKSISKLCGTLLYRHIA